MQDTNSFTVLTVGGSIKVSQVLSNESYSRSTFQPAIIRSVQVGVGISVGVGVGTGVGVLVGVGVGTGVGVLVGVGIGVGVFVGVGVGTRRSGCSRCRRESGRRDWRCSRRRSWRVGWSGRRERRCSRNWRRRGCRERCRSRGWRRCRSGCWLRHWRKCRSRCRRWGGCCASGCDEREGYDEWEAEAYEAVHAEPPCRLALESSPKASFCGRCKGVRHPDAERQVHPPTARSGREAFGGRQHTPPSGRGSSGDVQFDG